MGMGRTVSQKEFFSSNVLFINEGRATLDSLEGWARNRVSGQRQTNVRMRRQHGGGGIMHVKGNLSDLITSWKSNAQAYCDLLDKFLPTWLGDQPLLKSIFRAIMLQHVRQSIPPIGLKGSDLGKKNCNLRIALA